MLTNALRSHLAEFGIIAAQGVAGVAEVTKMIRVYHAPINDADAKVIADYLAKTY